MEDADILPLVPNGFNLAAEIDRLQKLMLEELMLEEMMVKPTSWGSANTASTEKVLMEIAEKKLLSRLAVTAYVQREEPRRWSVGPAHGDGTRWPDLLCP